MTQLLTGRFNDVEDVKKEKGMLSIMPRFQPGAFEHNIKIADQVQALAAKKGCTPAQLGINWSKKQGDLPGRAIVIPIPGASTVARVEENCTVVELTDEELKEINAAVDSFEVKGDRYPAFIESNT